MAGKSGGLFSAGMVVLTLAGSACGYDGSSNPTGPGYADTAAVATPGGYAISAAADVRYTWMAVTISMAQLR